MSYLQRNIDVTFQLGTGSFGEGGYNTIKISGRRVMASITKAGRNSMGESQVVIYGMLQEHIDALSTIGVLPTGQRRNTIIVEAGDSTNGMSTVFVGTIVNAYFVGTAMPNASFVVIAYAGLIQQLLPISPTSIKGPVDVATVAKALAGQMSLDFEGNGVNIKLPTIYLKGAARNQMQSLADAANINWTIDNAKLAIWPNPGSRQLTSKLTISPENGLVGYPTFDVQGIQVTAEFNPALVYGTEVQINSTLKRAQGTWYVYTLYHDLESIVPNGKWFTRFLAAVPGYVPVVA
jgi:Baseplate hub gp41